MTCATEPADVWTPKHPDAELDYAVDFEEDCSRLWQQWLDVASGTCIRVFTPGVGSGYQFRATQAGTGRTSGRHPQWRSTGTITDGSVVWTPEAISAASLLRTISGTPTWTVPDGITASSVSISGFKAIAKLAGGVDGQDYAITVSATSSPDGLIIPEVCILPVRIPVRVCS